MWMGYQVEVICPQEPSTRQILGVMWMPVPRGYLPGYRPVKLIVEKDEAVKNSGNVPSIFDAQQMTQ